MGHCYAQIGQITQGLGMVDAIRMECRKKGIFTMAAEAEGIMGVIMLDSLRLDDAIHYLRSSLKEGKQEHHEWIVIWGNLQLALAYFLKNDKKRAIHYLHEFVKSTRKVEIYVRLFPYLFELLWAVEKGELSPIPNLSLEREILQALEGKNIFLKGVAYRYQALRQRQQGLLHQEIMKSLYLSMELLGECGHQIELAKTQLETARQFLSIGDKDEAKKITRKAFKVIYSINEELIPDDLRFLIQDRFQEQNLIREILKLGQEVIIIRDNRDLVQHIISAVNRITGAERGAIFLLEGKKLQLRASKNITSDQISDQRFACSMKMIEEVAGTRKGRILGSSSTDGPDFFSEEKVHSRICVPMILKGKLMGVLYHDNRLISSIFKESDLELLAYFAGQAAIAMENARAYEEIQQLNQKLTEEKRYYQEEHLQDLHFDDIVGESPAIMAVLGKVKQVAGTDTTVLITGETGVGKELVARAIHRHSPRSNKPFVRVSCSALPESLIPSELFGHEKGAFTGAIQRRIGRFELANEGTIFLDEVGDLPAEVQVRLLRVLHSKEFERVGGGETLHSDFRLIAATNRNLEQAVEAEKFRADLYYRINVFPIHVPPLRERKEDIPLLADFFFKIYATKLRKNFDEISESEMAKLIQYQWPGNIRELENIIERACILSPGAFFRIPDLAVGQPEFAYSKANLTLEENERRHILWALQKTGWKVRGRGGAAELLNINFSTLTFRMKKLGITRPMEYSRRMRKSPLS
jgi:transcriptional regulator with GAF, ATPase, and Fis domain